MTELRVLPVRKGEAYLLKSTRGAYLVDSGGIGCAMPELLNDRQVRKLRAAICTSVSSGRLGGILDLLRENHPVGEYWLPEGLEILPELARRFNGDMARWLALAAGDGVDPAPVSGTWPTFAAGTGRRLQGAAALLALVMAASQDSWRGVLPMGENHDPAFIFLYIIELLSQRAAERWNGGDPKAGAALRALGIRLLEGGTPADLADLCGRLMLVELDRKKEKFRRGLRGMVLSAMISARADSDEARFRFFRPVDRMTAHLVSRHPIKCLNGVESTPLPGLPREVRPEMILDLTSELTKPGSSLTFQYGEADCGVLFCGDTRMHFLDKGEMLCLDRPTVITAPDRGSCRSERAYRHVTSNDPSANAWVRGFLPHSCKVSPAYHMKRNTFCLNNTRTLVLQEILLCFKDGRWQRESAACCTAMDTQKATP